jgi:signal recognition particle receptor subunit beta
MAETHAERGEVNARIVYWGVQGSGKSTNLRAIHAKLRPDHRGRLEQIPTRLDPSVSYERLPIELGEIAGVRTRIQIVAVPGAPEAAPTRKALLDRVDGIVFVVDAGSQHIDTNVAAFEELRGALGAYGRSLEEVPLVVQYNKQDLADPYVLEELHRKLDVRGAAVFEAVAKDGAGVLPTLTTISKRVVRTLRESAARVPARPAEPRARPAVEPAPSAPARPLRAPELEQAALAARPERDARDAAVSRAAGLLDASWPEVAARFATDLPAPGAAGSWRLVAAGPAHPDPPVAEGQPSGGQRLVVPLVLADAEGRELRLRLALALDLRLED